MRARPPVDALGEIPRVGAHEAPTALPLWAAGAAGPGSDVPRPPGRDSPGRTRHEPAPPSWSRPPVRRPRRRATLARTLRRSSGFLAVAMLAGQRTKLLPEQLPGAGQSRHHGADRAAQDLGDLSVREPLEIGQHDHLPGCCRQGLERALDVPVEHCLKELLLRSRPLDGRVLEGCRATAITGGLALQPLTALPAEFVQEGIAQDGHQPGPASGSGIELVEVPEGPEPCFLDQVLGFCAIMCEAERRPIQKVEVDQRHLPELWRVPTTSDPPEHGSPPERTSTW